MAARKQLLIRPGSPGLARSEMLLLLEARGARRGSSLLAAATLSDQDPCSKSVLVGSASDSSRTNGGNAAAAELDLVTKCGPVFRTRASGERRAHRVVLLRGRAGRMRVTAEVRRLHSFGPLASRGAEGF